MSLDSEIDPIIQLDELRVTLRLCFDAERSDRLTGLVHNDLIDLAALKPVWNAASTLFEASRWFGLLPTRKAVPQLLGPRQSLPAAAALSLAFHLGLGLNSGDLATLSGRSADRIGQDLTRARRVVGAPMAAPCDEFASVIGRQRDRMTNRDETLSLMLHLGRCDRCRQAHERSREVDEQLFTELNYIRSTLKPPTADRKPIDLMLNGRPLLWTMIALLGIVFLIGIVVGTRAVRSTPHSVIPLVTSTVMAESNDGWLLETAASGEVDAVNVSTGARRTLVSVPDGTTVQNLISPDQQSIAQITTSLDTGRPDSLRIFNLDGAIAHEWPLSNPQRIRIPLAWLNDSTMIVNQIPTSAFSPSFELFTTQTDQQGSAIQFNINTGESQTIFARGVRSAVPSPDGKFIAIGRYAMRLFGSVELRPFDGKTLGPVVGTLDESGFPIFWSPDSQRIYYTTSHVPEATPTPRNLGDRGLSGQSGFSYSIESLRVDGTTESVLDIPAGQIGNVVGVSPDGTHLIYVRGSSIANTNSFGFWQSTIDGKNETRLAPAIPGAGSERVVWSPLGNLFLTSSEPFYLPQAVAIPLTAGPSSFVTLMLDATDRTVRPIVDQLSGPTLIGYVPNLSDPVRSTTARESKSTFTAAEPVPGLGAQLALTSGSRMAPVGDQLLLYDRVSNLTVSREVSDGVTAAPLGGARDPAWLPDGSGIVGVSQYKLQQGSRSRIALFKPSSAHPNEMVEFDPANLGSASTAAYRMPSFSPDGMHLSFFVVDKQQVSLWIVGRNEPPHVVANWPIPVNARITAPLVSGWVGNDTLVVAYAEEWTDGYPLRIVLGRLDVTRGSPPQATPFVIWHTHGAEQGISITEIALAPDGHELAVRIRHFTGSNPDQDRFDSVAALTTSDLSSSLELARGKSGDGMSWAPDGSEIAVGLDGKIAVISSTGSKLSYPPAGSQPAGFPVWVRPNEIWFTSGSGDQASILRLMR